MNYFQLYDMEDMTFNMIFLKFSFPCVTSWQKLVKCE